MMKQFNYLIIMGAFLFVFPAGAASQKVRAEDVLAKHLESIGTSEARTAVSSRVAVGDGTAKFVSIKDQTVQGRVVFASEGNKNFIGMKMNSTLYPGERFVYDGKHSSVAAVTANSRSVLGNFVQSNSMLLESGLLGGTLSTAWPLYNLEASKGKLSLNGTKKIDGREVYILVYTSNRGADVDVTLCFDKETFRHVRTEYKRTSSAGIGARPEDSTRFSESRIKLVEDFSEFKTENHVTFPQKYRINYLISGQTGTTEVEWNFVLREFAFNQKLDPSTFEIGSEH
jgi:outer membrane lipoprotein-sorting protein